jgi:hypothetical protein
MSDYKDAALMLLAIPKAKEFLARRRLVPRRPRQTPHRRLHSSKSNRKTANSISAVLYKQRHKIAGASKTCRASTPELDPHGQSTR